MKNTAQIAHSMKTAGIMRNQNRHKTTERSPKKRKLMKTFSWKSVKGAKR